MFIVFKNNTFDHVEYNLPILDSEEYIAYQIPDEFVEEHFKYILDIKGNFLAIPKDTGVWYVIKQKKLMTRIKIALKIIRG